MKKIFLILLLSLLPVFALGQNISVNGITYVPYTVSTLPTAATNINRVFLITDGTSGTDCTVGSGTTNAFCKSNGTSYIPVAGGGTGSGVNAVDANGTPLSSISTLNFLNSAATNGQTFTFSNPSAGGVQLGVTGTLTVPGGGTGDTTLTAHSVLLGQGTSAITNTGAGTQGQFLQMGATDPGWSTWKFPLTGGVNTQCLTSNGTDAVWASCTAGSIGGTGSTNTVSKFTAPSTIGNSLITDDGTTGTYTGTGGWNLTLGPLVMTQIAAPTGSAGSSWLWADSTALRLKMKNNNNTAVQVVASGADINTSDQVTVTHLASALPTNQGGTGTATTLTGVVRGGNPLTAAELSGDATTSGSNAVTVVALRNAALPTLAASTGLFYDTAGTLSLQATLPTAAVPAFTGDVTNTAGTLATSVVSTHLSSPLPVAQGGTALASGTSGGILAFTGSTTIASSAALPANGFVYGGGAGVVPAATAQCAANTLPHGNGASAPTCSSIVNGDITNSTIDLTAKVTGILPSANGGTANGFFTVAGPATTTKTYTFPNASTTILTTNAVVTIGQGGTGTGSTLSGLVRGSASAMTAAELSGDATTSGSNAVTVVAVNGNSVPSGVAANQVPIGTAANTFSFKTIPDCNGSSNALNYTQSSFTFTCLSISTLSNPMTTLGDTIYGGSAGVVSRLAGPTAGNSPYTLISIPSSSTATAPTWSVVGVPVDTESGQTFTVQSDAQTTPDRASIINLTNTTTSTALTVPQAGSAGMLSNYPFGVINTGTVTVTATPTTSTVNNNATQKLLPAVAGHNPEMAFWWSDAVAGTGNWWSAEILPTDANGRLGCEGFMALTGDVTNSAGSCATVVGSINGGAFTGTNGNLVSFGAANIPVDSTIAANTVLTAASNLANGSLVQGAGANRTTSNTGIQTITVVTAASPYTSGGLVYASAASRATTNSADWAISSHTLQSGSAGLLSFAGATATAPITLPVASTPAAIVQGYTNAAGGTTNGGIAKLNGTADTIVGVGTSDTEAIGIVVSGAGTSGTAQVAVSGTAACTFDNTSTAGHYVQISTGTGTDCHDAGATLPTAGGTIIGRVADGGTAGSHNVAIALTPPGSSGGGGSAFPLTVSGTVTSGGIPYFNSTVQESSSALLGANSVMIGGGAGTAPSTIANDTTTTDALFATAGAPAFRAIAAGDLPSTLTSGTAITNAALTSPTLGTPASGTMTNTTGYLWNNLANATGALILANGTNNTTFNHTSATTWTFANTTAATVSVPQNSPLLELSGQAWLTGPATGADFWTLQNVLGAGLNNNSTLTFAHTGTTGQLRLGFPGGGTMRVDGGSTSLFAASGSTLSFGSGSDVIYTGINNSNAITASIGDNSSGTSLIANFQTTTAGQKILIASMLKATASLTAGQTVKIDTANASSVVVATTADTGAGAVLGFVGNAPGAAAAAQLALPGSILLTPVLGTGTCTVGQFVINDTTTNGRVKCTSTYTAGTVLGYVTIAQASVGSAVGVYVWPL